MIPDLERKLRAQLSATIRDRGSSLLRARAVRINLASADLVNASVQGTSQYTVDLNLFGNELHAECSCPYFEDRGLCKHIWATILAVDQRGGLQSASHHARLELVDALEAFDPQDDPRQPPDFSLSPPTTPLFPRQPQPPPAWQSQIDGVSRFLPSSPDVRRGIPSGPFQVLYILSPQPLIQTSNAILEICYRSRKKDGAWSVLKDFTILPSAIQYLADPDDRFALAAILGAEDLYGYSSHSKAHARNRSLPAALADSLIPRLAATSRLGLRSPNGFDPVSLDPGEPFDFRIEVRQDDRDQWRITGSLHRDGLAIPVSQPAALFSPGFFLNGLTLARFRDSGASAWLRQLRELKTITFPDRFRDDAFRRLLQSGHLPPLDADAPLQFTELRTQPKPGLRIDQKSQAWGDSILELRLVFDYGAGWRKLPELASKLWVEETRTLIARDHDAERAALEQLRTAGAKASNESLGIYTCSAKRLPAVVRDLIHLGWHVEAEGKSFRKPGAQRLSVSSGIDWFELQGEVDFDGLTASLPQLLAALRRGETMIRLGDGSFGLLPEDWLARLGPIAAMARAEDDTLRYSRHQAGLLDALLAAQPQSTCDEAFSNLRRKLASFEGVRALPQPAGFNGTLRHYQCEGVGWMQFLRDYGFGGCLADDMGVGKTAQVLATLEDRRTQAAGPSLVVAPKSLIFNWREEAARFTPALRVLDHTGAERDSALIAQHDLILTTYGTLRRDALEFKDIEFDYVVLDEAQAIKNASTDSAKAARLLRGRHRLALSGTPIENHLGELWSLFEFLNPGMLGEARALNLTGGLARNPTPETRQLLAAALRPFILRRTKKQVAAELPEKTEQTVYCEMDTAQKKLYAELRDHYRSSLLARIDKNGLAKSKVHVLEALLRLRQAACHPGLIDPDRAAAPSAKIEELFDRLDEIREEGHKALIFSQFTSLLALVRARLDAASVPYAYLDGATSNRQSVVERFQSDPACPLFLISLKAGGLGLNLTAAEYVFLLDPWWNPAVEAQAIDRAHRIGQTRNVFAYRLIARGTVEEKVLELQKTKRDLADSIIGEDNSLLRGLKREDLELLLS